MNAAFEALDLENLLAQKENGETSSYHPKPTPISHLIPMEVSVMSGTVSSLITKIMR